MMKTTLACRENDYEYYWLIMRCPACLAEGRDPGSEGQWYHHNCGGKLAVGDDANYYCKDGCGTKSHVSKWTYSCLKDGHGGRFIGATSAHLASAISTAGQITGLAGRQWLMRFLEAMGDW